MLIFRTGQPSHKAEARLKGSPWSSAALGPCSSQQRLTSTGPATRSAGTRSTNVVFILSVYHHFHIITLNSFPTAPNCFSYMSKYLNADKQGKLNFVMSVNTNHVLPWFFRLLSWSFPTRYYLKWTIWAEIYWKKKKKSVFPSLLPCSIFFFFLSLDTKVPRKNERLTEVQMKMETPDTVAQKN